MKTVNDISAEIEKIEALDRNSVEFYNNRRKLIELKVVLKEMHRRGLTEVSFLGPVMAFEPKPGDILTLPAGVEVHSYNPSNRKSINARDRKIKVSMFYAGFLNDTPHDGPASMTEARVEWRGTGGYWCWSKASDFVPPEVVAQTASTEPAQNAAPAI